MKTAFFLLVSASAFAAPVTTCDTTYSDGSTSSACIWNSPADAMAAFTQPAANELLGTASAEVQADSFAVSADSEALAAFFGITGGPVRNGTAFLTLSTDGDGGGGQGGWSATATLGSYSCSFASCLERLTIPFTLGVPFTIYLDATADATFSDMWGTGSYGGTATVDLRVFDMAGNPVSIADPLPTPEPAVGWALGVIALAAIASNRKQSGIPG